MAELGAEISLLVDPDATVCLDNITSAGDSVRHIVRKYAAVINALEAIDGLPVEQPDPAEGSFGYTAVAIPSFLELMFELVDCLGNDREFRAPEGGHLPVTFLDAGCGTGRNLHLVASAGAFGRIDARGIELEQEFIDHGNRVYRLGEKVECADCMAYDYGQFDIVYFYRPFSDDELEQKFERHLMESMAKGAYIAAPLSVCLDSSHRLTARGTSGQIWKKLR